MKDLRRLGLLPGEPADAAATLAVMTEDKPYTRCPYCQMIVEPNDLDSVYAEKREQLDTFGRRAIVDGMGAFFHAQCPPEAVGYARRPRP